jgi:hypothetical protein
MLVPKDKIYIYHPSGVIARFYSIASNDTLLEGMPFTAAGRETILARGSLLIPAFDPLVLWHIVPRETCIVNNQIVAQAGETLTYRELEARMKR